MSILGEILLNINIYKIKRVAFVVDNMREAILRWFENMKRRCTNVLIRRHERMIVIRIMICRVMSSEFTA